MKREDIEALVRRLETPFECYSIEMAKEDITAAAEMLRDLGGFPPRFPPPDPKRIADLGQRIDACMAKHGVVNRWRHGIRPPLPKIILDI